MADEQVGTVSVKAMPDTKGFRRKLKAELEAIEKSLEMTLEIGVQLSRADLLRARRELKALEKGAAIKVRMELDKSGILSEIRRMVADAGNETIAPKVKPAPWDLGEFTRGLRESIDRAVSDVNAEVPVELRDSDLSAKLGALVEDAERMAKMEITPELDDSEFRREYAALNREIRDVTSKIKIDADVKAAEAKLEGFLQQMRDKTLTLPVELDGVTEAALQAEELARSRQLDIHAVLHAARAAAQIAVLTHSRTLDVRAHLKGSGVGQIAGLLTGLAGARALYDLTQEVGDFVKEIDRSIPRIATMATAIGGISAAAIGAGGGLAMFVTGVGQALRGLLILPAAGAAAVTVFQVLKAAFRDAGDYVGDLLPVYSALGDAISAGFWEIGERGVRNFTDAFIPLARGILPEIARDLGFMANEMSGVITHGDGLENIGTFFENLHNTLAADDQAMGIPDLTDALLDLVAAGSNHLPALGKAFTSAMQDFAAWTERISNDGTFDRYMQEAAQATKDIWSVMGSTIRIFNAVADAAERAGSPSLTQMAAGLRAVADAAESTRGMGFMTTMFAGANTAIKNMIPGLTELGNAFIDLGPAMATVMEISGDIFSDLFSGLADILNNDRFRTGLIDMFEGFRSGMEAMRPAFHTMGTDIGMLFETFGMLADVIGRVIGVASQELGTVFQDLLTSIQAIIPVLGDWFIGALELVGPAVSAVADAIKDLVVAFPELAAALAIGAAGIGLAILTIGLIARPLVAAASGFVALKTALSGMGLGTALANVSGAMGGVSTAIGRILGVGARFLGWIGLAVIAFQQMWEHSEQFRDSFSRLGDAFKDLGEQLGEALAPAIDRIANESLPDLMDAFGELMDAAEPVFRFLGDSAAKTIEGLALAIEVLTPAIVALADGIADTFASALDFLTSLLGTWGALFQGDWDGVWEGLQDTASAAFDTIGSVVETGLETLKALMRSFLDKAFPGWEEWWTQLGLDAIAALADSLGMDSVELVTAVESVANLIKDEFSRLLGGDTGYFEDIGLEMISSLMAGMSLGFQTGETLLANAISTMVSTMVDRAYEALTDLVQPFMLAHQQVLTVVNTMVSSVVERFTFLGEGIGFAMENAEIILLAAVYSWFTGMLAQIAVGILEMRMAFNRFLLSIPAMFVAAGTNMILAVAAWWVGMTAETTTGTQAVVTEVETMPTRLQNALASVEGILRAEVIKWFSGMVAEVVNGLLQIVSWFMTLPGRVQNAISSLYNILVSEAIRWFSGLVAEVTNGINRAVNIFRTLPGLVIASISRLYGDLIREVQSWFMGMIASVISGVHRVVSQFQMMGIRILSEVSTIPGRLRAVGEDMMLGLIAGIMAKAHDVAAAARGVVEGAVNAARNALEINSPSKVFMSIGASTGEGMVKGIEGSEKSVMSAMTRMVRPPSPVTPGAGAAGAGGQEINVYVQAQPGEDPSRVGRRSGEALAFEIGRLV